MTVYFSSTASDMLGCTVECYRGITGKENASEMKARWEICL